MSLILNIESAIDGCSVAVSDEGRLVFHEEDQSTHNNAVSLGLLVDNALAFVDSHGMKLDAVAVSEGPGSYTGLRIGVSMAKGVCYGRGLKLIAVPTLKLLCVRLLLTEELPDDALLCPMIDARRMEVYSALYDRALKPVREIRADIVDRETYLEYLEKHPVWFLGNGSTKCRDVIDHPAAHFIEDVMPEARWMFPLAEQSFNRGEFRDVAYFEPYYLKDFIAVKPKKQV